MGQWTLAIVKRPAESKGFCLLPRRWVVERTFPWFGGYRRLAKDIEATIAGAYAGLYLASVQLLARRLAQRKYH
jgi:transposase